MKIGNLKVAKKYTKEKIKWAILGRKNGVWHQTNFENKFELIFDLKYDACFFLQMLYEDRNRP
jgi:hypothetical protein